MNLFIVRGNVLNALENNDMDICKATKEISAMYKRGCFTNEEYDTMIDMIAGYGITGNI